MYWNMDDVDINIGEIRLNSNIRCIEMALLYVRQLEDDGWIVTLDVLKFNMYTDNDGLKKLNSNIRCIEIPLRLRQWLKRGVE